MSKEGTVYWITGFSGAGKTTIGGLITNKLKSQGKNVIFLDGDSLRQILGNEYGYTREDREKLGLIYGRLCKFLSSQGFDVVCATISMFKSCWIWNKKNIRNYKQIYLKAPKEVLAKRDTKQVYKTGKDKNNVVGIDLDVEEPLDSDFVIINDGSKTPEEVGKEILLINAQISI